MLVPGLHRVLNQMKRKTKNQVQAISEQSVVNIPYNKETNPEAFVKIRMSQRMTTNMKTTGASCNTFRVPDSMAGIGYAQAWTVETIGYQGAPSLYVGDLRPKGSPISSGGTTCGMVEWCYPLDADMTVGKRTEKKNSAGLLSCGWEHPEVKEFLTFPFNTAYTAVYIPNNNDEKQAVDFERFQKSEFKQWLLDNINNHTFFVVKKPSNPQLLVNLCTEVEIPHKGTCQLSDVNLAQFGWQELEEGQLRESFVELVRLMESRYKSCLVEEFRHLVDLSHLNQQYGIGVLGLASMLCNLGVTYASLDRAFKTVLANQANLDDAYDRCLKLSDRASGDELKALRLVGYLIDAYNTAAKCGTVYKMFCVKPTVTVSKLLADYHGYNVSPELIPVAASVAYGGIRTYKEKSFYQGDYDAVYPAAIETQEEVSRETYLSLANSWQVMLNLTGKAHRHSFSLWGKLSPELFETWLNSNILSLYYRLPEYNSATVDKAASTSVTMEDGIDLDAIMSNASCGLKPAPNCAVCTG